VVDEGLSSGLIGVPHILGGVHLLLKILVQFGNGEEYLIPFGRGGSFYRGWSGPRSVAETVDPRCP
jgi:hypothetical protein